jgi:hypothetical protein
MSMSKINLRKEYKKDGISFCIEPTRFLGGCGRWDLAAYNESEMTHDVVADITVTTHGDFDVRYYRNYFDLKPTPMYKDKSMRRYGDFLGARNCVLKAFGLKK